MSKKKKKQEPIIAYKGFDKNLCCRGFQYEIGKEYKHDGEVKPCKSGFHACIEPIDVLCFYEPGTSRFCEVEVSGNVVASDDKIAGENIKIVKEIPIGEFVGICTNQKLKNVLANLVGEPSTNTGDQSAASNTGDRSAAVVLGNYSTATVEGKESIACGFGYECKAKACEGSWIALVEHNDDGEIIAAKFAKAGKDIEPDTFYYLKGGEFVKEEEEA